MIDGNHDVPYGVSYMNCCVWLLCNRVVIINNIQWILFEFSEFLTIGESNHIECYMYHFWNYWFVLNC